MIKYNYYNIIDFGLSRIRVAIFDTNLKVCFSESISNSLIQNSENTFVNLKNLIKKAEKKISSHIEDIILIFDSKQTLVIDVSLQKQLHEGADFAKAYESLSKEICQIIGDNYREYEIIHTIFNKGIFDEKIFNTLPENIKSLKQIKIDYKIICFPKKSIQNIKKNFNKNNLNITKIFCTSFLKTQTYINKLNLNKVSFLDIGYERSSLIIYDNKKLKYIRSINIGSNNITKDISKIFKIDLEDAEKIKKSFNKSDTEFSYDNNLINDDLTAREIIDKNISINLLKKVILYRVQEIFDLTFKQFENRSNSTNDNQLFLIGNGSILFKNNSFDLIDNFGFKKINFFSETDIQVCGSALSFFLAKKDKPEKYQKKQGLFEKFFNFFDK